MASSCLGLSYPLDHSWPRPCPLGTGAP